VFSSPNADLYLGEKKKFSYPEISRKGKGVLVRKCGFE
jgi:hypothetical protein